jgi:hypothetical protein
LGTCGVPVVLFACKKGEIVVVYAARMSPPALVPTN